MGRGAPREASGPCPERTGPDEPAGGSWRRRTPGIVEHLAIGGVELALERPRDAESLVDEAAFADDEYLPYWAERWPSGVALAHHVAALDLRGARVLELGCGLGLPSLVAARLGAEVVAIDWSRDAIALLERNAARNAVILRAAAADWREAAEFASFGQFDRVVAADVLYEERNAAPILALLDALDAPATIADPGRDYATAFLETARTAGFEIATEPHPAILRGGIHRLSRTARSLRRGSSSP